jgi:hypothetical protein
MAWDAVPCSAVITLAVPYDGLSSYCMDWR